MGIFKRVAAVVMICCFAVAALAGCHKKEEEVLDIAGTKITSSMYLAALLSADLEFQNSVNSSSSSYSSTSSDYKTQELDDKPYETWVKDRTLSSLKQYVYMQDKIKELNLSYSDKAQSEMSYAVEYYWSNYGYDTVCEDNGISKDDFAKNMSMASMSDLLFEYYYGEGGDKEIDKDEVINTLEDNYIVANVLSEDTSSLTDDQIAEIKSTFEGYKKRLEAGESFENIYKEYNEEDESSSSDTTSSESDEDSPKDKYASVFGSDNTAYASTYFSDISKVEVGSVKVIEADGVVMLVMRKDILDDDYYYDTYDLSVRYILKGEEFENDLSAQAGTLSSEELVNLDYYSPNKLVYSE